MPKLAADRGARPSRATSRRCSKSQPVIDYIRPVHAGPDRLVHQVRPGRQPYDANGHYARIQPIFNQFQFASTPGRRRARRRCRPERRRATGLIARNSSAARAAAMQPPPDGSAPWRDADGSLDCDPTAVPPGHEAARDSPARARPASARPCSAWRAGERRRLGLQGPRDLRRRRGRGARRGRARSRARRSARSATMDVTPREQGGDRPEDRGRRLRTRSTRTPAARSARSR